MQQLSCCLMDSSSSHPPSSSSTCSSCSSSSSCCHHHRLETLEQQWLAAIGKCLIDPLDVGLGEAHRLILTTVGLAAVDTLELDIGTASAGQRAAHIELAGIELGGTADASAVSTAIAARLRRRRRHMHDGALLVN